MLPPSSDVRKSKATSSSDLAHRRRLVKITPHRTVRSHYSLTQTGRSGNALCTIVHSAQPRNRSSRRSRGLVPCEPLDCELDQLAQPGAASLEVRNDRVSHARLPEAPQVPLDAGDRRFAVRLAAEESLDVVSHLDEIFGAHAATPSCLG